MSSENILKVFNVERWHGASTRDRARVLAPCLRPTPVILAVLDAVFGVAYPHTYPEQEADWLRLRQVLSCRDEDPTWREQARPVFLRVNGALHALVAETADYPQEEVPLPP